ncbi:MAG: isocitrate lyase/phosphoenolpyruvate mutase family protein [Rhodobacteraceae bacterium]|nr:isocitrate lyase/phosphoenolpyruvate mutase family protein [Paracoccaceae bacterium]
MTKASAFRDLHHGPGAFVIPNPWDIGSARILAALGFRALATTSAGFAFSRGVGEGTPRRAAVLAHCRELVAATDLPVSADLERGFGDSPESVAEAIRSAAETGLAGASIEDHTGDPGAPIYDPGLAADRISAAAEAARGLSGDFVLTARCENFLWGREDLADTIRRLQSFEAAGADVLFAPGLRDLGMIAELCQSVSCPVNVIMGIAGADFSVAQVAEAGAKRISVGSGFARRAYGAMVSAAREILDGGTFTETTKALPFAEFEAFFAATG